MTVAIPDPRDTDKLDPKSIVAAVPTVTPLSLTWTPLPVAVIFVKPDPSPTNWVAVNIPDTKVLVLILSVGSVVVITFVWKLFTDNLNWDVS